MKYLKYTLIILSTSLLFACGGSGGNKATNPAGGGTPNGNTGSNPSTSGLKKVLPFNLQETTGTIAFLLGPTMAQNAIFSFSEYFVVTGSGGFPGAEMILFEEIHDINKSVKSFEKGVVKCDSGYFTYSVDLPITPGAPAVFLKGFKHAKNIAQKCTTENYYFDGTFEAKSDVGGAFYTFMYFLKDDSSAISTTTFDYLDYTVGDSDKQSQLYLTGNEVIRYSAAGANKEVNSEKSFKDFSKNKFVINDEHLKLQSGKIQEYSYTAEWTVQNNKTDNDLYNQSEISKYTGLTGELGKDYQFQKGNYKISLMVNEPLEMGKDGNGLLYFSKGSITVNLLSHGIIADIIYHPGYADVVYANGTGVHKVRVDAIK